jgi:nucleoside-diphosphate-sugar epimerase
MPTTLITGGAGLIGACLAEKLLARGDRVVLFDPSIAEHRVAPLRRHGDRLRTVRGDVQSLAELLNAIREHDVSAIVHLAYLLGTRCNRTPESATRVNVVGTVNVLEAARLARLDRVLLASSIAVYGPDERYAPGDLPLHEDVPLHVAPGLLIYGGGKLYLEHAATNYAREFGLTVGGLRPAIVYGPGREHGSSAFIGELIDRAATGEPVTVGFGDARVSLVHVEDVAEQFLALLHADPRVFDRRRFFNTGGDTTTVRGLVAIVRRLLPDARIEVTSNGERDIAGLTTSVSDRALEVELGYKRRFMPLDVGVRAQINAARSRAGLPLLGG